MTAAEFSPDFRYLIDARLDAIDQVLRRVNVPYSERRNIVGEVETQIYELLSRRCDDPTREDVLAVLDSLDPPESYIPEDLRERFADRAGQPAALPRRPRLSARTVRAVAKLLASVACFAAWIAANGVIVLIFAASHGVMPWLVTVGAIAWLNYAAIRWLRSRDGRTPAAIIRELRNTLAAWIASENGETAAE